MVLASTTCAGRILTRRPSSTGLLPMLGRFPWRQTLTGPYTVSRDYSWVDGRGYAFHIVVCMTQSQVDTDVDGLPDPVDLSPDKPSSAENLGHPSGSAVVGSEDHRQVGWPGWGEGPALLPGCRWRARR